MQNVVYWTFVFLQPSPKKSILCLLRMHLYFKFHFIITNCGIHKKIHHKIRTSLLVWCWALCFSEQEAEIFTVKLMSTVKGNSNEQWADKMKVRYLWEWLQTSDTWVSTYLAARSYGKQPTLPRITSSDHRSHTYESCIKNILYYVISCWSTLEISCQICPTNLNQKANVQI